jgi:hypothetical protein
VAGISGIISPVFLYWWMAADFTKPGFFHGAIRSLFQGHHSNRSFRQFLNLGAAQLAPR